MTVKCVRSDDAVFAGTKRRECAGMDVVSLVGKSRGGRSTLCRIGRRSNGRLPTMDDFAESPLYTGGFAGVHASVSARMVISRQADSDDEIGGYLIQRQRGDFESYVMHRNPNYWKAPKRFDPTVFGRDPSATPLCYFPFGGGASMYGMNSRRWRPSWY